MNKEETNHQLLKALSELEKLHPKKIDLGLSRIYRVLKKLGNPHKKLPTTIHVAGTNGKGSTVAYLKAFSEAQGKKVHVYTSPHLVNFNERIVIASEKISDEYLVNILNRITIINDNQPLSFFEATTAAALLAFSEIKADLCIIEVGLGGRYDATNVIIPDYCAITPIDLDHSEFLGNDIAKIAKEKGGIIKEGIPVVVGPQSEITRSVLENEAYKNKSQIKFWGTNFKAHRERGRLIFENNSQLMDLPLPALHGDHQVINAGTAIAVALQLGISQKSIKQGLNSVSWPARMQYLQNGALADMVIDSGAELWLDGGHNPHAAIAIGNTLAELEARQSRPLILIIGILKNKDINGYLEAFKGLACYVIAVDIPGHASLPLEKVVQAAKEQGINGQIAINLIDAVQRAINTGEAMSRQSADEPIVSPRILICGSLYLAGEVLKL